MMKEIDFIRESNRLAGIRRKPRRAEVKEYRRFMALDGLTVDDMIRWVSVYQPGAELRDRPGLDVRVGIYQPPPGGIGVRMGLVEILDIANRRRGHQPMAYQVYIKYLKLHPFMNGNARSGRMLWMWMMKEAPRGFLHTFHNQTLASA